jgi:hypothetical protein
MKHKILRSFIREADGTLVNTTDRVVSKMRGNAHFPNPPAALATIADKALPEYRFALANAGGRDSEMVSIKNDKKAALVGLLLEVADYVTETCKGDRSMLLSSGFILNREKGESEELSPISKLDVETGAPEQAVTRIKKVKGARAYLHQYTTDQADGEAGWISRTSTNPSYLFTGLKTGVKHSFRVIAIGAGEHSVYSPVVMRYIQ